MPRFVAQALSASLLCLSAAPALAQSDEEAAIRAVALDYIEGWYEGDGDRMASALHPELAKRVVITPPGGESTLTQMGAEQLVASTARGAGADTPVEQRHREVTVLDVYENAASVRIYASGWVDYLHMAKWNGEWKIVNVLYELHPETE
jgi:hypothetical protein